MCSDSESNKSVFPLFLTPSHVFPVLLHLQFSLKTSGIYRATISDDRGKDMSQIDISGKGKHFFRFYIILLIK